MKLKINVERVVDKEHDTVLEWVAITERLFKFVSWLLILGVLSALYAKTNNILVLIVIMVLWLVIAKLIAKILLFVVHITVDGVEKYKKTAFVLGKLLTIVVTIPIVYAIYLLTSSIMQAFGIFPEVPRG